MLYVIVLSVCPSVRLQLFFVRDKGMGPSLMDTLGQEYGRVRRWVTEVTSKVRSQHGSTCRFHIGISSGVSIQRAELADKHSEIRFEV